MGSPDCMFRDVSKREHSDDAKVLRACNRALFIIVRWRNRANARIVVRFLLEYRFKSCPNYNNSECIHLMWGDTTTAVIYKTLLINHLNDCYDY
jgi:hypothetical protein